jgi:peptide deformylase
MAIRKIRTDGDEILKKRSREVSEINERIITMLKDMADTMYSTGNGVGLAAPQVGLLKRMVVIDIGDGLIELINPVIKSESGEQLCVEGCLSVPGVYGEVKRPAHIVVEALNANGEKFEIEGEGLLANVLSHEIDHLDGILFKDKVERFIDPNEEDEA